MKIGIIGAGAMGSLLGFYLSEHADVWLLDRWQAQVEAINANGLRCERDGVETLRHPRAATSPDAIGPCDAVLVLVKAHQTAWAAEQAQLLARTEGRGLRTEGEVNLLSPQSSVLSPLVVTLQNGIGNRELLAERLGAERVGQAVTALGATLLGPGHVRHAGQGPTTFSSAPDRAGMAALAQLFASCGLPSELVDETSTGAGLDALVWSKLIVNVGINALTALLRIPNGALATSDAARELLEQAVIEALAVAAARGTPLLEADPLAHVLEVARATAANRSSMLQDVLRGSPTEIETINGAIVREGLRVGVPTPVNSLLTTLVRALDTTAGVRVRDTA